MQSDDPVIEQDGANSLLLQAGESVAELRSRFYRSVAETLTLLHTAPGYDRDRALGEVVRLLAETMDLPLVWIGRRAPDCSQLDVLAAAGPASDYAKALQLSNRGDEPGGNGPMGLALRLHRAQAVRDALKAAGVAEDRIILKKPETVTGGSDAREARRVEISPAA